MDGWIDGHIDIRISLSLSLNLFRWSIYIYLCEAAVPAVTGCVHLRRPRIDRERLIPPAVIRVSVAVQRVAADEPARKPGRPSDARAAHTHRAAAYSFSSCSACTRKSFTSKDSSALSRRSLRSRAGAASDRRPPLRGSVGRTGLAAPRIREARRC